MADHFSGPRAVSEPTADITDLYAFPSPERPGYLARLMNVFPFADPSTFFGRDHLSVSVAPGCYCRDWFGVRLFG